MAKKHAAHGSTDYATAIQECSEGIVEEFFKYACESCRKLCETKSGSKCWRTISRELLLQRSKTQSIPALKSEDGIWSHDPRSKADLLADSFSSKNVLPDSAVNEYTTFQRCGYRQEMRRTRSTHDVRKNLEALDVNSGTGPDLLPARILQFCANELSVPILKLVDRILETGEWPKCWREHWVVPI